MNPEEDIPTRVTRGALRRRSVDQEATPQKTTATSVTGTPNKTNSTTKRVTALNPIQEGEGRPSTPIAGRTGRRRMSETVDTPTSLPNKLVQNLKEAGADSGSGKRSRNASLTEENLKELNVAYEGSSSTMLSTRSRTPARVRASHDSLVTSGSPVTVTPAVRRSTRRNSVTSDDGNISVQSLPITTPKTGSGLRTLKDDTIIEEDAADDRAESVSSETSARQMRSQSILSLMSAPASPRSTTASPVLTVRNESTPPRKTPRVAITPLSLSKKSPRSKNVSFSEDSKRDDSQSSFPKTPTSVGKEVFIMVADLRNSELKGVSPKADAVVDLSPKTVETENQQPAVDSTPKSENVESDSQALIKTVQSISEDKTNASAAIVAVPNEESTAEKVSDNDVSGIDVLESSVKEVAATEAEVNEKANQSLTEGNKFPKFWTQSVRRSATHAIDVYTVPKEEEQERLEEPKASKDSSFKASLPVAEQQPAEDSDEKEEDDDEEMQQRNEFVDDEALEVEGYQSGDSKDEELKEEIEQNEIYDHGEDLGSEDTEEYDEDEKSDDYDDANDSWIVSDGNEVDEDQLLRSSNEDLTSSSSASPKKTTLRKRKIITICDDSDEEQDKDASVDVGKKSSPSKSPKSTTGIRRSATPNSLLPASDNGTIEKSMVTSLATSPAPATPSKKIDINSPVKLSSNKKKLPEEPVEAAASAKEDDTTDCSVVMFEDANEVKEKDLQKNKDTENSVPLSTSPTKADISRKSLPADAANLNKPHVVADVRKSLPASTKMPTSEQTNVDEVEKIPEIDQHESIGKEEVIDLEESGEVETSFPDNKEQNESSSSLTTLEQPVIEVSKPERKSMPLVSMISAQFYIGGTKKRNTIGGGDSSMLTSTPKPNDSSAATNTKTKPVVVEKMNSNGGNSVVRNPFALANSTKLKSRVSLDSAPLKQSAKKSRLSLPSKLFEEDLPSGTETRVNGSQEPEPMEVDEVIETEEEAVANEEANKQNDDGETDDDDVSVQEVQQPDGKQRTKMVKPKPKALEDYDLTNILVRCNEVLRENKERKKQLASVLRKKKEEKKRRRELDKQEELQAAKNAAAAANNAAEHDADPNSTNVSTGIDSTGQGEEPTKKKKKRKPKAKNYLLEELAETKKERLEQALRHQLEVAERRKQRKKNRQLEKKKQLGKENEDAVSVTGGIGAKLEKMKKKKKAKENGGAKENDSKNPPVRVALSAYAVFNQQPNNQTPLSAVDGKQKVSPDTEQLVVSPVEKKQLVKSSTKKEQHAAEPVGKVVVNQTDKQVAIVHKSLSVDDAAVSKKKQHLTAQSASNKMNPPLLQSASDGLMSKKQKKKQPMTSASGSLENVQQSVLSGAQKLSVERVAKPAEGKTSADTEPYSNDEKPKEKKKKKELVAELPLNGADSDNPKQKKNRKIKLNGAAEFFREKLASAMDENHPTEGQVRKIKKGKKKLTSQVENGAKVDSGNVTELSRKKSSSIVMEPTVPVPSIVPAKKRKREQQGDSSVATTPRPAKHTKLGVLQRIESGGFFVENVTPDKVRLKRNFGFQERAATPAKQLGFKVTSLLPTGQDELRSMAAASSKMYSKDGRKKSKFGDVVGPERTLSLPLPVWTSSGVFLESAADGHGGDGDKKTPKDKPGYIQLKSQGKGEFNIKTLRPEAIAEKPHRVDPATIDKSVLNFKRQQLLEKTAHLREKKNQRV